MISRAGEIVLGIIGIVIFGLLSVGTIMVISVFDDDQFQQELNTELANNPEVAEAGVDTNQLIDMMSGLGWFVVVVFIAATILGIVATILLKKNKRSVASGIIFLATAVIGTVLSVFFGIIGGIFYLIAGIMALVRKPVTPEENADSY